MSTQTEQHQQARQKQLPDLLGAAYVGQMFFLYSDDNYEQCCNNGQITNQQQTVLARSVVKTIINRGAVLLVKPLPLSGGTDTAYKNKKNTKLIRLRRNEKSAGYAVQKKVNGVWHFRLPSHKRHRDTWLSCEETQ